MDIEQQMEDMRTALEKKNHKDALRHLSEIEEMAVKLKDFECKKYSIISGLNTLESHLKTPMAYISGLQQHYGKIVNHDICPIASSSIDLSKAGQIVFRLKKELTNG